MERTVQPLRQVERVITLVGLGKALRYEICKDVECSSKELLQDRVITVRQLPGTHGNSFLVARF